MRHLFCLVQCSPIICYPFTTVQGRNRSFIFTHEHVVNHAAITWFMVRALVAILMCVGVKSCSSTSISLGSTYLGVTGWAPQVCTNSFSRPISSMGL